MDLVSNVVSEFPELQGLMGEYYYIAEHPDKKNVAQAIREHYMPRFANDALPETVEGSIVSVADKIDTIVGCYYAGIIPTGSQDPYALRRQALGLANIIIDKKWSLPLYRLINIACEAYASTGLQFGDDKTNATIHQFFEQRLLKIFKDMAMPNDIVQAVMKVGYDDFYDVILRAEALAAYGVVETFFEKILVMDEDPAIRANRLALVKRYESVLGAYYKLSEVTNA